MEQAMTAPTGARGPRREVARYGYRDSDGTLLYEVVRYVNPDGSKSFLQCRPAGLGKAGTGAIPPGGIVWGLAEGDYLRKSRLNGGGPEWISQRNGEAPSPGAVHLEACPRVPYRLPEFPKHNFVFTTEGEGDSHSLDAWDLFATTNAGGAGGGHLWTGFAEYFRGKRVCHLLDNDGPGRKHAIARARALAGVVVEQAILELPGVAEGGGDISDWIRDGHTEAEFRKLVGAAEPLTSAGIDERAARWGVDDRELRREQPSPPPSYGEPPPKTEHRDDAAFKLTKLGALLKEPKEKVAWLLYSRLPAGGLGLMAGKPKAGKSTWVRCLCLAVARGEKFLGWDTAQGPVIYVALEEKRDQVRQHFEDLGGTDEDEIYIHCDPAPAQALLAAQRAVALHKPVLLVIDPLLKFVRVKDANDYVQITNALEPLLTLARESGAHVLLVYHMGKGDKPDPVDSALGSTAFAGSVDTLLVYKRTEKGRTLVTVQRYGTDLVETMVTWDPERRSVALGAERTRAEIERIKTEIIEILSHLKPGSVLAPTEEQICGSIEGKNVVKRAALRELMKAGEVTRQGAGKRGDPFHYRLPSPVGEEEPKPDSPEGEAQEGLWPEENL
jgi:hypothetical protein